MDIEKKHMTSLFDNEINEDRNDLSRKDSEIKTSKICLKKKKRFNLKL